jgi:hypothetical protein
MSQITRSRSEATATEIQAASHWFPSETRHGSDRPRMITDG